MTFSAECPHCKAKVTATTMLAGDELKQAIANNREIEVMHTHAVEGDHRWKISDQDKKHLRSRIDN